MIASDLHGDATAVEALLHAYRKSGAERLILLGDLLYHGPRNDLPREYAPKEVIALLNEKKDMLLCVRGNCDTEVDQMVLAFPILADYAVLDLGKKMLFLTHGHHFGEKTPPPMREGDILMNGHTHVPKCVEYEQYIYMNPGSVSIPKEGSAHGYMTLDDGVFLWKDLDGSEISRYELK